MLRKQPAAGGESRLQESFSHLAGLYGWACIDFLCHFTYNTSMRKEWEIIIISFTDAGSRLNAALADSLAEMGTAAGGYAVERFAHCYGLKCLPGDPKSWIGHFWGEKALVFIGASGIAVRYIAPWVEDKFTDSPVVVMDEKAGYVIPLLSGHAGGAVKIAEMIARCTGAVPVFTTATDVQNKFAVDVFAGENRLKIMDRKLAKQISAAVLENKEIGLFSRLPIGNEIAEGLALCDTFGKLHNYCFSIAIVDEREFREIKHREEKHGGGQNILYLLNKRQIAAGIGCRRGTQKKELMEGLSKVLDNCHAYPEQLAAIASIDLKKDEAGILELAREYHVPFRTFPARELEKTGPVSVRSKFVEKTTGVDNVCERAAKAYFPDGEMIQPKVCLKGITVSLVEKKSSLWF